MYWTRSSLNELIHTLNSCLCVGLDTDINKLPIGIQKSAEGILHFNKEIIDYTFNYTVAYKINAAFYEVLGGKGWDIMAETIEYVRKRNRFAILDAKRGDIGNTGDMYAKSAFVHLHADAVTVAPYMGKDSVMPFLNYNKNWTVLLGLTSNPGADDFQLKRMADGAFLYEEVIRKAMTWADSDQLMFVTGATRPEDLKKIRQIAPDYFLLIPGVGAQGGELDSVMQASITKQGDILINASRSIIYASSKNDFAIAAETEAHRMQVEMAKFI